MRPRIWSKVCRAIWWCAVATPWQFTKNWQHQSDFIKQNRIQCNPERERDSRKKIRPMTVMSRQKRRSAHPNSWNFVDRSVCVVYNQLFIVSALSICVHTFYSVASSNGMWLQLLPQSIGRLSSCCCKRWISLHAYQATPACLFREVSVTALVESAYS